MFLNLFPKIISHTYLSHYFYYSLEMHSPRIMVFVLRLPSSLDKSLQSCITVAYPHFLSHNSCQLAPKVFFQGIFRHHVLLHLKIQKPPCEIKFQVIKNILSYLNGILKLKLSHYWRKNSNCIKFICFLETIILLFINNLFPLLKADT